MFLRPTEHKGKVNEPRPEGRSCKHVDAVPATVLEVIAGGQVEEIECDEILMMDTTDEPSGGGAAAPAAMGAETVAAAAPATSGSSAPAHKESRRRRSRGVPVWQQLLRRCSMTAGIRDLMRQRMR